MKYDTIEKPKHYNQGNIETIDIIKDTLGSGFKYYLKGNVLKYIIREEHKGKEEDLKKAKWYLEKLIQEVSEKQSKSERKTNEKYNTTKDNTINSEIYGSKQVYEQLKEIVKSK